MASWRVRGRAVVDERSGATAFTLTATLNDSLLHGQITGTFDGTLNGSHFTSFFYSSPRFGDRSQVNRVVSTPTAAARFGRDWLPSPNPRAGR